MRRSNKFHIALEIITILSTIVIGVTIWTFIMQGIEPNKSYIGSIILAMGVTEMVEFFSLKDLARRKHVLNAIAAGLSMIFGLLLMFLDINLPVTCLVTGIVTICLIVIKGADAAINLLKQPFLQSFIIILCILEMVFAIVLIVRTIGALNPFLAYLGVALLVKAFLLVVEFIIHRYQK